MQDSLATTAAAACYSKGVKKVSGHTRLYRRGAVYWHRAVVPADIVDTYGKREELISLCTKERTEALRRVRIKAVEVDNLFEVHRKSKLTPSAKPDETEELTAEQMHAIKAVYHAFLLEEDEAVRIDGFEDDQDELPSLPVPNIVERYQTATVLTCFLMATPISKAP